MATTREEFFKVLKQISARLDRIGGPTTFSLRRSQPTSVDLAPTNSILNLILTELTTLNSTDFATQTTLALMATDLGTIDTSLNAIEADADASRIDLAAIEVLITSTNTKLDTIDASVQDVEGNTGLLGVNTIANIAANLTLANIEGEVDNLEEQVEQRDIYKFDTHIKVTSIAGGSTVYITIIPDAGNHMRNITVLVRALVQTDVGIITLKIFDGVATTDLENRILASENLTTTAPMMWPSQLEALESNTANMDVVMNGDAIHIRISGCDVDDEYQFAVRAQMRESSGTPTTSTANTDATITTTQTRNTIDSS